MTTYYYKKGNNMKVYKYNETRDNILACLGFGFAVFAAFGFAELLAIYGLIWKD